MALRAGRNLFNTAVADSEFNEGHRDALGKIIDYRQRRLEEAGFGGMADELAERGADGIRPIEPLDPTFLESGARELADTALAEAQKTSAKLGDNLSSKVVGTVGQAVPFAAASCFNWRRWRGNGCGVSCRWPAVFRHTR